VEVFSHKCDYAFARRLQLTTGLHNQLKSSVIRGMRQQVFKICKAWVYFFGRRTNFFKETETKLSQFSHNV